MARAGGFPVDDEDVLETVARMLRAAGAVEPATIMRTSRCRFERTGYDNWDGGTNIYTLFVEIAAETFVGIGDRKSQIEESIAARLGQVVKQFCTGWYGVELVPLVVALPGRPDLEGGPVSHRTRRTIIDMLRNEGMAWQGALSDLEFLRPVFDLDALPSTDNRFENAAGDIRQHRVNNPEDWPGDWVFSDERFDLFQGADVTFLMFVERLVSPAVRPDQHEAARLAVRLNEELRRSGWTLVERETLARGVRYSVEPWDPLFRRAEQSLRTSAAVLSSAWMHQEIDRIEVAIDTDPALAIGTASTRVPGTSYEIARVPGTSYEIDRGSDL